MSFWIIWACALGLQAEPPPAVAREIEAARPEQIRVLMDRLVASREFTSDQLDGLAARQSGRTGDFLRFSADEIRFCPKVQPFRRYTLKSQDRTLIGLILELRKASGASLSIETLLEEKSSAIRVDVQEATYLEALEQLSKAADIRVDFSADRAEFAPARGHSTLPEFFIGGFGFRLEHFSISRTIDFRRPPGEILRIELNFFWEPSVRLFGIRPAQVTEARDEAGNDLLLASQAESPKPLGDQNEAPLSPSFSDGLGVLALLPPSRTAKNIARLRGTVSARVAKSQTVLEFDEPKIGSSAQAGDYSASIRSLDLRERRLELTLASRTMDRDDLRSKAVSLILTFSGHEALRARVYPAPSEGPLVLVADFDPGSFASNGPLGRPFQSEEVPWGVLKHLELAVATETEERKIPFEFCDVRIR